MLCDVTWDSKAQVLDIRSHKWGARMAQIKVEKSAAGTMNRVDWNGQGVDDADNYWMAVKPSDATVFEDGLMSNKALVVKQLEFELV